MRGRTLKIVITATVLLAGIGFLVYASLREAEHYKMVDDVMVEPDRWTGKRMRIHGFVEAGSIDERIVGQSIRRTFVLEKGGHRVLIRHLGPTPDSFRDQAEVVARGTLGAENDTYVFIASSLTAKCPSKYEGAKSRPADKNGARPLFQ